MRVAGAGILATRARFVCEGQHLLIAPHTRARSLARSASTPYTLYPIPYTLFPITFTLYPIPYIPPAPPKEGASPTHHFGSTAQLAIFTRSRRRGCRWLVSHQARLGHISVIYPGSAAQRWNIRAVPLILYVEGNTLFPPTGALGVRMLSPAASPSPCQPAPPKHSLNPAQELFPGLHGAHPVGEYLAGPPGHIIPVGEYFACLAAT